MEDKTFVNINPMLPDKLAFVDIETTGTSARYGRIIEIGIVRVEENKVVQTYRSLINPETHIPPEIEMLTGITAADLEGQPLFRHIHKEILEMLVDCVFVAHNVRFDYGFLKHEFVRENIDFTARHFCTVKLSRLLYPRMTHHNLDAIIERFGFSCEKRHRAFDDANILWQFYQNAQENIPVDTFTKAVHTALRHPSTPIKLKQEDLDSLPELPGVYTFYGENGMPLYVGKSINIKDRVLSHFSGDLRSSTEMNIAQQVESIETSITAGELGALFLEAQTIKKLLPLYNRMLRNKRELVGIKKTTSKDGYETVSIESLQTVEVTELENFLGFFRSKKQAKEFLAATAKEFTLCEKLLGLEKTASACFGYRLDRCKGACVGKETQLFYNLRFTTAFFKTKIRPWPFGGPVIIEEKNELTAKSEYFLIDKWCYLGSVRIDDADSKNTALQNDYIFDLDMYKILTRFLSKTENVKSVKQLSSLPSILREQSFI